MEFRLYCKSTVNIFKHNKNVKNKDKKFVNIKQKKYYFNREILNMKTIVPLN